MSFAETVFASPYLGWILAGAVMTMVLAMVSLLIALPLAAWVATGTVSASPSRRLAAMGYVLLFRNLPPVPVLLLLVALGPVAWRGMTGGRLPSGWEFLPLVLVLASNTSAYLAESLRAGLRAVPVAQADAARVLGLSAAAIRHRVLWPQALRIAWPDTTTRLMHHLKNTTIAAALPLALDHQELAGQAARIAGETFAWAEPLMAIELLLLLLVGGVAWLCHGIGRHLDGHEARR